MDSVILEPSAGSRSSAVDLLTQFTQYYYWVPAPLLASLIGVSRTPTTVRQSAMPIQRAINHRVVVYGGCPTYGWYFRTTTTLSDETLADPESTVNDKLVAQAGLEPATFPLSRGCSSNDELQGYS